MHPMTTNLVTSHIINHLKTPLVLITILVMGRVRCFEASANFTVLRQS